MCGRSGRNARAGFTLIEMLTVIAIIMLVMAMALPNFVQMMKQRRWTEAIGTVQAMVMRARALATNERKDMAVEFDIQGSKGTWMWIESEEQILERIPDLDKLQHLLGGGGSIYWIRSLWHNAGGTDKWGKYECKCRLCGHEWVQYSAPRGTTVCPGCNDARTGSWPYWPDYGTYYYDFKLTGDPADYKYGDNARQSELVKLSGTLTINDAAEVSPNFINWDSEDTVECYGYDAFKDIRIGTNGALVQTLDPVLCIKDMRADDYKRVQVVRCTGRLIPAD